MMRHIWLFIVLTLTTPCDVTDAKDWPTYRGDARRSGYTDEALPDDLTMHWRFISMHAPQPAWSDRDTRVSMHRYNRSVPQAEN